ncbi:MAG: hypothetical protein A2651_01850 [Candidatus Yanofskybacteria bacterium RIFCSPHIGHO2_01_FULL_42_12]|uniref:Colicin V production protein n=1 Tax=Candidatus Yanofskybacteria bacterium RIFCSPLOWO2_01_FULL_42_49 TaxID=1802694 RepID=A0A1F8GCK8_9BACT|nr:MAG: hypothetical protein A2651_01850 [Candidatus Yanofskybacteria bacterium RIFCSPHIGHO2_01_FULL_42_12]OGN22478.1 MAG: hypothetical protein A2918_01810 [Candidatus Yanofskybacteria bacterium RIFCSPLOWO2_01_FULL_42_49]
MNDFLSVIWGLDFSKLVQNLNFSPTTLFVGLVLVFLMLYGLSLGRTKALVSLLSIYVALAFDATFPYLEKLYTLLPFNEDTYYTARLTLFLLVYLVVFAILNNSFAKGRFTLKESSIISVGVISLSQIGLLVAVITNIIPDNIIERMPEYLSTYFSSKEALFYWIIIPVIILVFLKKGKKER